MSAPGPAGRASLRGCMPRCPRSSAMPVAFFGRSGATCLLAGRAQDRLVHELQAPIARRLGLDRGPDAGFAELMGCYHAYTRAVRALLSAP
jgi:hypothetical protein